jgi:hypothetical protein
MVYSSFGNQTFLDMRLPALRLISCVSPRDVDFPAVVLDIVRSHFLVSEANFRPLGKKRA